MKRQKFIYLLIIFSAVGAYCNAPLQANFDAEILRAIHTNRNISLDRTMLGVSNSLYVVLPAIPIGLFVSGVVNNDKDLIGNSIQIGSSGAISAITVYGLKQIIRRDRPFVTHDFIENIGKENGFSMPSGHTAVAFSLATAMSLQYPKWYIIIPSYLWASAVGYSRMHLGVHYLTDVIIGAIVGAGVSYITFQIEKEVMKKYR